ERLVLEDLKTKEEKILPIDGVFIYIGLSPQTELYTSLLNLDSYGFISTDENMQTSVSGMFAAVDIRVKPLRQIVTALGDGAIAGISASKYIEEIKFKGGI
ncbi:MAG: NAD(P)/FAD-dependent oxidoreductase, partial [Dictyoglomaceae bacterium]|nr:NAD(P)/FAD-dependent oxidoreductase [Dictyoglomaceae bacterium]